MKHTPTDKPKTEAELLKESGELSAYIDYHHKRGTAQDLVAG